ncbi:MAG TPA: peptidoglycan-binding protein [Candidatus Acidoferrum sp.]|nr:peptidoglycan-binding protein [Candidatus Acidoferrum sp.]
MSHPVLRLFDGADNTTPNLSDDVKVLQGLLNQDGAGLTVDGVFGRDTEAAVIRFQNEHGLASDGIVGPITWAALTGTPAPDPATSIWTTIPSNDAAMTAQLAKATDFKDFIQAGAAQNGFQTTVIAGIGSRESNWGLALKPVGPGGTGDFGKRRFPTQFRQGALPADGGGFGRGLMQIDFDAQEFARTGNWQDPKQNILNGCQILASARDVLQRKTNLSGADLLRAAIAAYNCGAGNVLQAIQGGHDVDFFTTGRNYSSDVLNRAGWFQTKGWS